MRDDICELNKTHSLTSLGWALNITPSNQQQYLRRHLCDFSLTGKSAQQIVGVIAASVCTEQSELHVGARSAAGAGLARGRLLRGARQQNHACGRCATDPH